MSESPKNVALFVTCLVDLFRPSIGFAAIKLMEDAGCTVAVPDAQTCCGANGRGLALENDNMEQALVSGIAHAIDEAKVTVSGVPDIPGIASKILGPIGGGNIEVDMIVQNTGVDGMTDFTFTVKRQDYGATLLLLEKVAQDIGAREVTGDNAIAKVSIVGVGMRSHAGVATKVFDRLASENINIQMISTSEIKISVVIAERYVELAVRALHDAFELDAPPAE